MYCYRCNSVLDPKKNTCTKCGADIRMFRKIVYASNRCYNDALLKAKTRDLSGARALLKRSLFLYKKNIAARNLLGLVEYAMGEPAAALAQWTRSKNMSRGANLADRFIGEMRRSSRELDSENRGVQKFNQALSYVQNNASDMAVIQLKKVLSVHPNMIKAYLLLALLYMRDEKTTQAKKILEKCLKVDRGNATALLYLSNILRLLGNDQSENKGTVGENDREQLIIPVRFRDYGSYLTDAVYVLLGVILGFMVAWFVVVPGEVNRQNDALIAEGKSYQAEISDLQASLNALIPEITESETPDEEESQTETIESIEKLPETVTWIQGWTENQNAIKTLVEMVNAPDYQGTGRLFLSVNPTMISKANVQHYVDLVRILVNEGTYGKVLAQGEELMNAGNFSAAASVFETSIALYPNQSRPYFLAAQCYENLSDLDMAASRYWLYVNLFPEGELAAQASSGYMTIRNVAEVPGLPEGVTRESLLAQKTREEFLAAIPDYTEETAAPASEAVSEEDNQADAAEETEAPQTEEETTAAESTEFRG